MRVLMCLLLSTGLVACDGAVSRPDDPVLSRGGAYRAGAVSGSEAPSIWSLGSVDFPIVADPGAVAFDRLPLCDAARGVYSSTLGVPVICSGRSVPVTFAAASGLGGSVILKSFTAALRASGVDVRTQDGVLIVTGSAESEDVSAANVPGADPVSGIPSESWVVDQARAKVAVDLVRVSDMEPAAAVVRGFEAGDLEKLLEGHGVRVASVGGVAVVYGERSRVDLARQLAVPVVPETLVFALGSGSSEGVEALAAIYPDAVIDLDEVAGRVYVRAASADIASIARDASSLVGVPYSVQVEATVIDWAGESGLSLSASLREVVGAFAVGDGSLVLPLGDHTLAVSAVSSVGSSSIVANPSTVVRSGSVARLSSGDQVPIVSLTFNDDGSRSQSVSYRDTGVVLHALPVVRADGTISADVQIELTVASADQPPSFKTRAVDTSALVTSGQSLVVGGLVVDRSEYARSGLPLVSRVGFGGARSRRSGRGELVVVLTLRLVRPDGRAV